MRDRALIVVSLALNAALGVAVFVLSRGEPDRRGPEPIHRTVRHATPATNAPRTHVVVRRQFFQWSEVESDDYRAYIANLRDIGCPEETIRDIIVADVNEYFERKRLRQIVPDDPVWWKGNPQAEVAQSIARQQATLDRERRELLTELLGPGWDPPRTRLAGMVFLTGPVLGVLPDATKLVVQDIITRSVDRERRWRRENERSMDDATLAQHRQQTREELAKVLTPVQLEEYLLRWSHNAGALRERLGAFDLTPEQFRALFRASDALQQQVQLLAGADDDAGSQRRERLETELDLVYKQALGPERFEEFKLNQNPGYVQARELAARAELAPALVKPLYEILRAGEEELGEIRADTSLTSAELEEALAAALKDQADTLRELLGEDAYRKFKAAREQR